MRTKNNDLSFAYDYTPYMFSDLVPKPPIQVPQRIQERPHSLDASTGVRKQ